MLGAGSGDHVAFVVNGTDVRVVNTAIYAMRILQDGMACAAGEAGII